MFLMKQRENTPEERRANRREACAVPMSIREAGRSPYFTKVVELSQEGCAIDGSPLLGAFHATVQMTLPGSVEAKGVFVWSNGKRTGLKFVEPLAGDTFDFLVRHVANEDDGEQESPVSRRDKIRLGYAEEPLLRRKHSTGDGTLSSMIAREVARSCNHRAETRFPIQYTKAPATIEHCGRALPLRDLSASGLGIGAALGQEIGERIELRFEECAPMEGCIAWKKPSATGIALEKDAISLTDEAEPETED